MDNEARELTVPEMECVTGGSRFCLFAGATAGLGLLAGPAGWGYSAVAAWWAYENGCFS